MHVGGKLLHRIAQEAIREVVFSHLHTKRTAGHFGRDKTQQSSKPRFYCPGMSDSVRRWCKLCQYCARCRPGPGKGKSPLKQFKIRAPMECMAVDILGPFPITRNGNEYIIVLGVYYTKWKEAFAVPNHKTITVAEKLVTEVFCRFGCPQQLHTDQGHEFILYLYALRTIELG